MRGIRGDPPLHTREDGRYYQCTGPCAAVLHEREFQYVQRPYANRPGRYLYRHHQCRGCRYTATRGKVDGRGRQLGSYNYRQHGRIPARRMYRYLYELEARCGSVREAAARLGIKAPMYLRWQGRTKSRPSKFLHRETAARILLTLRRVREETRHLDLKWYVQHHTSPHAIGPSLERRCRGCGTPYDDFTPNCPQCWTRRQQRERRRGDTPNRRNNFWITRGANGRFVHSPPD